MTERHSGRFTFTTESRRSDIDDADSAVSAVGASGSPVDGSPVSKIGRFAVTNPKEAEIHDVIKRNKEQRRTGSVQDTLATLGMQVSALIDRNAFLEAEVTRLRKKCGEDEQPPIKPHL